MQYGQAGKADLPALTALWHACFGDKEADIQRFWTACFDKIQVYTAKEGKALTAMLCILPSTLVDEEGEGCSCGYFYAVCTAEAYRGRGICRKLMSHAEAHCGHDCAALVPATEELFGFYQKLGYLPCFYQTTYTVSAKKGAHITSATPQVYRSIRELQLYGDFLSWEEFLLPCAGSLYRIETEDGLYCACAIKDGDTLYIRELLPDSPEAAAALAAHLRCKEAHVRTAGDSELFGLCKALNSQPLPQQAYLGLAFD